MSPGHNVTRALAASLAVAALAAPSALADNLRPTDTREPATAQAQRSTGVVTGGVRTPAAPTVVEIKPAQGFDWTSAAIGTGIALALIAIAAIATVSSRSRRTPP